MGGAPLLYSHSAESVKTILHPIWPLDGKRMPQNVDKNLVNLYPTSFFLRTPRQLRTSRQS